MSLHEVVSFGIRMTSGFDLGCKIAKDNGKDAEKAPTIGADKLSEFGVSYVILS